MNEGEHGNVPANQALENLKNLVWSLAAGGGISLLIYCVRGPRIRDVWKENYDMFYEIICQEQVPIILCVTGLENECPMENWWTENGNTIMARGMKFEDHVCMTASKGKQLKDGTFRYEEEYELSKEAVMNNVEQHCKDIPWTVDRETWFKQVAKRLARHDQPENPGVLRTNTRRNRGLFINPFRVFFRELRNRRSLLTVCWSIFTQLII